MQVVPVNSNNDLLWDDFISSAPMATFLHSRRFLAYHQDRFIDQSLLIYDNNHKLLGVFPAAVSPTDSALIVSHPGITFGGILHQGKLVGALMVEALQCLIRYYREQGFQRLHYKVVPSCYQRILAADDSYALFQAKAVLYRRDLNCVIDLTQASVLSTKDQAKLRNIMAKAAKLNVSFAEAAEHIDSLWATLTHKLKEKYQVAPVHSLAEIKHLLALFPDEIKVMVALVAGEPIAGAVLFISNHTVHTQYLILSEAGKAYAALDFLIQHCIEYARQQGFRYFAFGISTENNGSFLNQDLYAFKAKHGGMGVCHDFYELDLHASSS